MMYLDHNAAAPLRPEAVAVVQEALGTAQANPSSAHAAGRSWRSRIEAARGDVALLLGARPHEIVLTGSGTEACHLALYGILEGAPRRTGEPPLILATPIEHAALREPLEALAESGHVRLRLAPVDASGCVVAAWFAAALADGPALAVCQWANNETGVIQPVPDIADACHERGVPFLVDAVSWVGRGDIDLAAVPIDCLVVSSAKLGGPAGVGALFVREGVRLAPVLGAGGQESGLRGGTENILGIIGFAAAAAAVRSAWPNEAAVTEPLIARLVGRVLSRVPGARLAGEGSPRVANTAQFLVPHDDEEMLILALDRLGYAVSAGSACAAGAHRRSHVLSAMGVLEPGLASVRVSIGTGTTAADLDDFTAALRACVAAAQPEESAELTR